MHIDCKAGGFLHVLSEWGSCRDFLFTAVVSPRATSSNYTRILSPKRVFKLLDLIWKVCPYRICRLWDRVNWSTCGSGCSPQGSLRAPGRGYLKNQTHTSCRYQYFITKQISCHDDLPSYHYYHVNDFIQCVHFKGKELSMCLFFLFVKWVKIDLPYLKTRRHSSRMCTAPLLTVVCVCVQGVSGGVCLGRCVSWGGGGVLSSQVCPGMCTHTLDTKTQITPRPTGTPPGHRGTPPTSPKAGSPHPHPPDTQKPVKILPCPELRLRTVIKQNSTENFKNEILVIFMTIFSGLITHWQMFPEITKYVYWWHGRQSPYLFALCSSI